MSSSTFLWQPSTTFLTRKPNLIFLKRFLFFFFFSWFLEVSILILVQLHIIVSLRRLMIPKAGYGKLPW